MATGDQDTARRRFEARRRRRIARRRHEILEAAARAFAEKGYANATIREVAGEADIAEGTIYNYFEGKRDLLLGIADHLISSAMDQTLSELAGQDPEACVGAILRSTVQFTRENRAFLQALATEVWTDEELQAQFFTQVLNPVFTAGVRYLREYIAKGEVRRCQVEIVLPTVAGSLVVLSILRALAPEHFLADFSDDVIVDELTRLYSRGLRPDTEEAVR